MLEGWKVSEKELEYVSPISRYFVYLSLGAKSGVVLGPNFRSHGLCMVM